MRPKFVMGNWKMNGRKDQIIDLLQGIINKLPSNSSTICVVFPPAIYLPLVQSFLLNSTLSWGAQNVFSQGNGAFTGELSAPMLTDYGCHYVLVGHSERRHLFHESEKFVAEKFHHVKDHDMIPVLCIGETLEERQQGRTEQVLQQQLLAVTHSGKGFFQNCVIAYEPVWAIGTGQTASPEQAQEAHAFIRGLVAEFSPIDADRLPILYGGSVNEKNASLLFAKPDVDGGLVGGASLNAEQFAEIVKCTN